MDRMAGLLWPFCDKGIPILWRPFHEGDGDWFWWGEKYHELLRITEQSKITLIGEIGTLPDVDAIHAEKLGWSSFMTWSGVFCLSEEFNG